MAFHNSKWNTKHSFNHYKIFYVFDVVILKEIKLNYLDREEDDRDGEVSNGGGEDRVRERNKI